MLSNFLCLKSFSEFNCGFSIKCSSATYQAQYNKVLKNAFLITYQKDINFFPSFDKWCLESLINILFIVKFYLKYSWSVFELIITISSHYSGNVMSILKIKGLWVYMFIPVYMFFLYSIKIFSFMKNVMVFFYLKVSYPLLNYASCVIFSWGLTYLLCVLNLVHWKFG